MYRGPIHLPGYNDVSSTTARTKRNVIDPLNLPQPHHQEPPEQQQPQQLYQTQIEQQAPHYISPRSAATKPLPYDYPGILPPTPPAREEELPTEKTIIRVYATDGTFKSFSITNLTTAAKLGDMFSEKADLKKFRKSFNLKELRVLTSYERILPPEERILPAKKEWEKLGYKGLEDQNFRIVFMFSDKARARLTLKLQQGDFGLSAMPPPTTIVASPRSNVPPLPPLPPHALQHPHQPAILGPPPPPPHQPYQQHQQPPSFVPPLPHQQPVYSNVPKSAVSAQNGPVNRPVPGVIRNRWDNNNVTARNNGMAHNPGLVPLSPSHPQINRGYIHNNNIINNNTLKNWHAAQPEGEEASHIVPWSPPVPLPQRDEVQISNIFQEFVGGDSVIYNASENEQDVNMWCGDTEWGEEGEAQYDTELANKLRLAERAAEEEGRKRKAILGVRDDPLGLEAALAAIFSSTVGKRKAELKLEEKG